MVSIEKLNEMFDLANKEQMDVKNRMNSMPLEFKFSAQYYVMKEYRKKTKRLAYDIRTEINERLK